MAINIVPPSLRGWWLRHTVQVPVPITYTTTVAAVTAVRGDQVLLVERHPTRCPRYPGKYGPLVSELVPKDNVDITVAHLTMHGVLGLDPYARVGLILGPEQPLNWGGVEYQIRWYLFEDELDLAAVLSNCPQFASLRWVPLQELQRRITRSPGDYVPGALHGVQALNQWRLGR